MKQFFKGKRFKVFISVVAVLIVCVAAAALSSSRSSPLSSAFGAVFSPVQRAAAFVSGRLNDIVVFGRASEYESEIEALSSKIADCEQRLVAYDEAMYRLDAYENMLGLKKDNPDYELVYSNIIGTDAQDLFSTLILDKGSTDGISVNDPVVYGSYVVGVVRSVNATYSVVKTLLDPSVNVGAYETKSRETGYVTTNAELSANGEYMLSGLNRDSAVARGGIVCTSGIGGVYPKGFIIGTVEGMRYSEIDISSYAVITPGTVISDLQDVFVITAFEGQGIEKVEE